MDKFTVDDSLLSGLRHRVATALRLARARPGIVALSLVLACHGALAQAVYHITPLGSLDGCTTYVAVAAGLNEADQVTGSACTPTSSSHAFLWKNDGTPMVDLGPSQVGSFSHAQALNSSGLVIGETSGSSSGSFLAGGGKPMRSIPDGLGGNTVQAWAINGRGQVTGSAETGSGAGVAFLWKNDGSPMLNLGALDGGGALGIAINASGQVTGQSATGTGTDHAFVWENNGTPMLDLGSLGGGFSQGLFINRSGQVAGNSDVFVKGKLTTHAFLWKNDGTPMHDLGSLGGPKSHVTALNVAGQVAGNADTARLNHKHAFVWLNNGAPMKDLGTLGGSNSRANDMNSSGQVTGKANLAGNAVQHAFLWRNNGTKIEDLNALIDASDPLKKYVTLFNADFINDGGDIVADGTDSRTGLQGLYLLRSR